MTHLTGFYPNVCLTYTANRASCSGARRAREPHRARRGRAFCILLDCFRGPRMHRPVIVLPGLENGVDPGAE